MLETNVTTNEATTPSLNARMLDFIEAGFAAVYARTHRRGPKMEEDTRFKLAAEELAASLGVTVEDVATAKEELDVVSEDEAEPECAGCHDECEDCAKSVRKQLVESATVLACAAETLRSSEADTPADESGYDAVQLFPYQSMDEHPSDGETAD